MATKVNGPTHLAAASGVNFGDLNMYVAGGGLPEGDYALEFHVQMYQAQNAQGVNAGPARLGVMVTAHSLTDASARGDNARTQFYSMGSNADKTFAPNPETGKGLVIVPGAAGATLNNQTNWAIFLKSLYDSGLPNGIFSNDLTVLDGVHVHMANVPEPEERKGFMSSRTGEAVGLEPQRKGTIAIVTEIKDDGKPWEGTGGVPAVNGHAAAVAHTTAKPAAVAATPIRKTAPAPQATAPVVDTEDTQTAAINGISKILESKPLGCPKVLLKIETFKEIKSSQGEDMAQAVQTVISNDQAFSALLGSLGYGLKGAQVVPLS